MKKITSLFLLTVLLAAAQPAKGQDPNAENPVMHTFGTMGAQAVFCNYMAIVELAELFGAKVYDAEKVVQLSNMYIGLTGAAKDSLTDLIDAEKLNESDETAVKELVIINDHLLNTAKSIVAFAGDASEENEASYEKNRQKSWKSLSKFLDLE